uniref:Putative p53-mediated apoptosis protein n=1 Tax=Corethrella appendiculata TaxID=1370023 RepID=U5EZU0_9DIPT
MDSLNLISTSILSGIIDSIKGIAVIFYLDREMNKKLSQQPSVTTTSRNLSSAHLNSPRLNPDQIASPMITSTPIISTTRPITTKLNPQSANSKESAQKRQTEESKVWKRVLQCCVLNGGIFGLSIILFEYALMPGLNLFLNILLGSNSSALSVVWSYMNPSLFYLFQTIWVVPLFLLSKIVNSLWFQDIADCAYKFRKGRPQLIPSISKLIADTIISLLVQILFILQSWLVGFIPYVGSFVHIFHMSLLCSLYSFEYKWFNMGWELHKRLTYIETNWPYFFGFGLPLALVSELPRSWVISGCIFSIFFPLFILSANEASPKLLSCMFSLKLFSPVVAISNAIFSSKVKYDKSMLSAPIPNTQPSINLQHHHHYQQQSFNHYSRR